MRSPEGVALRCGGVVAAAGEAVGGTDAAGVAVATGVDLRSGILVTGGAIADPLGDGDDVDVGRTGALRTGVAVGFADGETVALATGVAGAAVV